MNKNSSNDRWKPCEPGTLLDMAENKAIDSRRDFLGKIAASSTVVIAFGMVVSIYLRENESAQPVPLQGSFDQSRDQFGYANTGHTKMTCKEVLHLLSCYVNGRIQCRTTCCKIKEHLRECESCRTVYHKMIACNSRRQKCSQSAEQA